MTDMTGKPATRILGLALVSGLALGLSACGGGGIQDALGYGKDAPDEFAIVTKAPLTIPPDFSLRPPRPGAPRPQEIQPQQAAENALFGTQTVSMSAIEADTRSRGEQQLLAKADAADASSEIRDILDREGRALSDKDKSFVDSVVFWQEQAVPDERLVDASAESRRIQQNEALGKPVTEGETPTVEPESEGWLDGIF
ncbi:DUF3035 domain-containing protein [Tepidicaulis sp. LMO-SS28]|uniref:DUF3035 domain-containing protein n=1 Tax=Tepidicaulis sp. LMO-SS28 TaxID=3447455 RepID=UPI003EE2712D